MHCELPRCGAATEEFQVSAQKELQSQTSVLPQVSGLSLLSWILHELL